MPKKAPKKATEEKPKVVPVKKVEEQPKVVKKTTEKKDKKVTVVPPRKAIITNTSVRPKEVVPEKIGPSKTKRFAEDKYDKISEKAGAEKFREMGQKVQNGTHQWAYYTQNSDGIGYHYYLRIKE